MCYVLFAVGARGRWYVCHHEGDTPKENDSSATVLFGGSSILVLSRPLDHGYLHASTARLVHPQKAWVVNKS